jgi:hypothetical protein
MHSALTQPYSMGRIVSSFHPGGAAYGVLQDRCQVRLCRGVGLIAGRHISANSHRLRPTFSGGCRDRFPVGHFFDRHILGTGLVCSHLVYVEHQNIALDLFTVSQQRRH